MCVLETEKYFWDYIVEKNILFKLNVYYHSIGLHKILNISLYNLYFYYHNGLFEWYLIFAVYD